MMRLLGRMLGAIVPICRADPLLNRPRQRTIDVSARNSSWLMRVNSPLMAHASIGDLPAHLPPVEEYNACPCRVGRGE